MNLTQKTAQQILDAHHLGTVRIIKKESLGITASVFCVNNRFILKFSGLHNQDRFRVERNALMCDILAKNNITAPRVIALDTTKKICGEKYVIMTRLAGDNLAEAWPTLSNRLQQSVARQYGAWLARIHRIRMKNCGDIIDTSQHHTSWYQFITGRYRKYLEYLDKNRILSSVVLGRVHDILRTFDHLLRHTVKPVLLHVDFQAKNIKYRNGKIIGIFDFDECLGGHNEFDFTKVFLPYTIDTRFREMIFAGYQRIGSLSDEFPQRVRLYSLGFLLNALWFSHSNKLITPALKAKYVGGLHTLLGELAYV